LRSGLFVLLRLSSTPRKTGTITRTSPVIPSDYFALAPLVAAALRRGDDVVIASGENLADWVQSCGFEFAPVGMALPSALAESQKRFAGPGMVFRCFTTVAVPPMAQDLLGLANTWRPDLIVHEETEYAAPLVAKLLAHPCVTQSYTAPARPIAERAAMRSFLDPIWSDHGAGLVQLSGDVYLDVCPPGFQTDDVTSITGLRPIRPIVFDGPTAFPPDRVTTARRPARVRDLRHDSALLSTGRPARHCERGERGSRDNGRHDRSEPHLRPGWVWGQCHR
jgi:hypothetical protein